VQIRIQTHSKLTGKVKQGINLLHIPLDKTERAYEILKEAIEKLKRLKDAEM
jgi:hypothetical protein